MEIIFLEDELPENTVVNKFFTTAVNGKKLTKLLESKRGMK